jgi:hypothetical protein
MGAPEPRLVVWLREQELFDDKAFPGRADLRMREQRRGRDPNAPLRQVSFQRRGDARPEDGTSHHAINSYHDNQPSQGVSSW